jgi:Mor family transcriptional regulator
MDINKWIKEVKTEDIPPNFQDLANEIGIEALLKMTAIIGGLTIYIPKTDFFIKPAKERLILQEYNGYNVPELAIKYGVSDAYIRKLVNQDLPSGN